MTAQRELIVSADACPVPWRRELGVTGLSLVLTCIITVVVGVAMVNELVHLLGSGKVWGSLTAAAFDTAIAVLIYGNLVFSWRGGAITGE